MRNIWHFSIQCIWLCRCCWYIAVGVRNVLFVKFLFYFCFVLFGIYSKRACRLKYVPFHRSLWHFNRDANLSNMELGHILSAFISGMNWQEREKKKIFSFEMPSYCFHIVHWSFLSLSCLLEPASTFSIHYVHLTGSWIFMIFDRMSATLFSQFGTKWAFFS